MVTGLVFDPEDGGACYSETFVDFQRITRRYIIELFDTESKEHEHSSGVHATPRHINTRIRGQDIKIHFKQDHSVAIKIHGGQVTAFNIAHAP
jgi:hypothetical protein